MGGVDIAEIPGRHAEGDRAVRRAEGEGGSEIVDDLRDDARPVDRVDCREVEPVAKPGVGEHRLHEILAVVEITLDGDGMDIGRRHRCHLAALHLGDAVAARLDGGRAGIARGRADDGDALAALGQQSIEQPSNELQRIVLEGQGRAVEEFHQPEPAVKLLERRHRGVAEAGIGRLDDRRERQRADPRAGEGGEDARCELGIGEASKRGELLARKYRHALGNIEAAIGREPGEQDLVEIEPSGSRGVVAGADIMQRATNQDNSLAEGSPASRPPQQAAAR